MAEQSESLYFLKELFPDARPELLRLLLGAADNAALLRSDFHTVRDWLDLGAAQGRDAAYALSILMLTALEEGSLCIEVAEPSLTRRLRDLVPETEASDWAKKVVQAIESRELPGLIGSSPTDHRPIIVHAVGARRFLYFQKYLRAELAFQQDLQERFALPPPTDDAAWPGIVQDVLSTQPLRLDRDQELALGTALLNNFAILSGGPGTGKTSIVLTLLRCLIRAGVSAERIALAAPTGRAAQRLTDALRAGVARLPGSQDADSPDQTLRNLSATTLHQLLGYRPSRNTFTRHRENRIPADVVIADEVSMIGLVLMAQLLEGTSPRTRLILLGDKDQLPSVDAGAVLASLVPEGFANGFDEPMAKRLAALFPDRTIPAAAAPSPRQNSVVLLGINHRSQEQIRAASQAINAQDISVVERLPAVPTGEPFAAHAGCYLLEQMHASPAELRGFLQRWIDEAYFGNRLDDQCLGDLLDAVEREDPASPEATARFRKIFTLLDRFRLLTLVRDGAWGCDEINAFLAAALRPRLDRETRSPLFVGAPVLITRNDASRGLYNGDVGIALRPPDGTLRVVFDRQEGPLLLPAESLPAHELGFALTVHKSQGSEYQNVLVVLPPTGGRRLLTKELIYTAITRAKSVAILCSTREALQFAIARRIVRESGVLLV